MTLFKDVMIVLKELCCMILILIIMMLITRIGSFLFMEIWESLHVYMYEHYI